MKNNYYLKFPALEDKDEWTQYVQEFKKDDKCVTPLGYSDDTNYEQCLQKISNNSLGINLAPGRVKSTAYFFMKDNRIIGNLIIR